MTEQDITALLYHVHRKESLNRRITYALLVAALAAGISTVAVLHLYYSQLYGALALVCTLALFAALLRMKRPPWSVSLEESSALLDTKLNLKERFGAMVSLTEREGAEDTIRREFITYQLIEELPAGTNAADVAPFTASRADKITAGVAILLTLLAVSLFLARPQPRLQQIADKIKAIVENHLEVPPDVRTEALALAKALSEPTDGNTSSVQESLTRTKEALEKAIAASRSKTTSSSAREVKEQSNRPPPSQLPPPTQTPEPQHAKSTQTEREKEQEKSKREQHPERDQNQPQQKQQQQQQQQQRDDSQKQNQSNQSGADKGQNKGSEGQEEKQQQGGSEQQKEQGDSQQQGDSSEKKEGSQQQKSDGQQGQGEGEGKEGDSAQSDSASGAKGQKESNSSSGQGQGQGKEQGEKQQSQSGDGEPSDKPQAGAQAGSSSPSGGQSPLEQLEQQVKEAAEQLAQEEQKNAEKPKDGAGQSPSDKNKGQGNTGQQGDQKEPNQKQGGNEKETNASQQEPQPKDSSSQGAKQGATQSQKEGATGKEKKDSPANNDRGSQSQDNNEPQENEGKPSDSKGKGMDNDERKQQKPEEKTDAKEKRPERGKSGQGEESGMPDRNATAQPLPAGEEGQGKDGLGPRRGFKESEIKDPQESFDTRFTGQDSTMEKNEEQAEAKTSIEDLTLAKPTTAKAKGEQPIPLEYSDVLE